MRMMVEDDSRVVFEGKDTIRREMRKHEFGQQGDRWQIIWWIRNNEIERRPTVSLHVRDSIRADEVTHLIDLKGLGIVSCIFQNASVRIDKGDGFSAPADRFQAYRTTAAEEIKDMRAGEMNAAFNEIKERLARAVGRGASQATIGRLDLATAKTAGDNAHAAKSLVRIRARRLRT